MSNPDHVGDTLTLPNDIEKRVLELKKAPSEEARIKLEAKMLTTEVSKPMTDAKELSPAELKAIAVPMGPDRGLPYYHVIQTASGEVGYHEKANNGTKYGRWYGANHQEWCDMFVSWVFSEVGQLKAIGGKQAYVPSHYDWFREHKRFHRRGAKGGGPQPGCLIFFDLNGHDGVDHIGIVASWTDTHVHTVEGNRSDHVRALTYPRSSHQIYGYGYPDWKY
jgi:hypothetical protein